MPRPSLKLAWHGLTGEERAEGLPIPANPRGYEPDELPEPVE